MVTLPDDLPVTLPFDDTVAMRESEVAHWKFRSTIRPLLSRKTADNCTLLSRLIVDEDGVTVTIG